MSIVKKNKPWTLADSNFAWDMHHAGLPHKTIALKLGRTEKAVEINISKTRVRIRDESINKSWSQGAVADKPKAQVESADITFNGGEMIAAVVGGVIIGSIITYLNL
tara:strand:+ start:327 stop:647 length:321 start_codon:yes stop_codon:yes gene_type:complete